MSNRILSFLLLIFSILGFQQSITAQDDCALPPPNSVYVTSVSSTTLTVSWTPVSGALWYQVSAREVDSGLTVAVLNTVNTSQMIEGLDPDTAYEIEVRARRCNVGSFGEPSEPIVAITSVIIVDIILQLDVDRCREIIPQTQYFSGSTMNEHINLNTDDCILIGGQIAPSVTGLDFEIGYKPDLNSQVLYSSITNGSPTQLDLDAQGPVIGLYRPTSFTSWDEFVSSDIFFNSGNLVTLSATWKETVRVTTSVCSDCKILAGEPGGGREEKQAASGKPAPPVAIGPNPAAEVIRITSPADDYSVEIFDMNGQQRLDTKLSRGSHEFNISGWPRGTYILHAGEGDTKDVKVLILN